MDADQILQNAEAIAADSLAGLPEDQLLDRFCDRLVAAGMPSLERSAEQFRVSNFGIAKSHGQGSSLRAPAGEELPQCFDSRRAIESGSSNSIESGMG